MAKAATVERIDYRGRAVLARPGSGPDAGTPANTELKPTEASWKDASGGTLFLDEIGNLSLPLQAKLLAVLQNRQVTRLGSNKAAPIDVRLICATNE